MAASWPRTDSSDPSDPHRGWDTAGPRQTPRPTEENERHESATKTLVALAGAALIVGACTTGTPTGSAAAGGLDGALVQRSAITIEFVTHGQAQDGFWGVVRNGVKAGAADMGVTANYSAPGAESDMPGMVSPDRCGRRQEADRPGRVHPEPRRARRGDQEGGRGRDPGRVDELGLGRVQGPRRPGPRRPDRVRGRPRRRRAVQGGRRQNAVCFNQEVGNQALTLRCNGFFMGLTGSEDGRGPDRQHLRPGRHAGDDRGGARSRTPRSTAS